MLGFTLGITLSLFVVEVLGEIPTFLLFGGVVGLSQWLVLRKVIQKSGWWILATGLGAAVGLACTNAIHRALVGISLYIVVIGLGFAVLGLLVGFAQWWVLRRHLKRTGWWILASAAGWFVGGSAAWVIHFTFFEFFKIIADFAILGVIGGVVNGVALVLLCKRPALQEGRKSGPVRNLLFVGGALLITIMASVREHSLIIPDNLIQPSDLSVVIKCSDLPPRDCDEDDSTCSEMVFFEPTSGPGYNNYPINWESWDNQFRSYLRRDLRTLIKYASARVACETTGWEYWAFEPIGLGDMSEADGGIPGTSVGDPGHIMGTHEDGNDIDVAYFQQDIPGVSMALENLLYGIEGHLLHSMCKNTRFGTDVYHCIEPSRILDPWRTALFIAYVAESPYTRVIGVDGQIGPVLDDALDQLVQSGWIENDLREQIPLAYESTNEGMGWFRFHHHHLHISLYLR
jgi:hypothetical protein